MHTTRYLIVGGGLTADAACKGIREVDGEGRITVVAAEAYPPYARPPLSKALWKGTDESSIWRGTEQLGVELRLGRRIVTLDPTARRATDDQGEVYAYERLLLATGGRPRRFPFGADEVIYYRTLDDYRRLRERAAAGARFVVVGGGFIGSEIAAALAMNGRPVTMVFPEPGIGARMFPPDLSAFVTDYYRARDVEVLTDTSVTAIEPVGDAVHVTTGDGRVLETDAVVAGLGLAPSTELAEAAGLEVSDGIVVDDRGRVDGRDDVFAAGDVARFPVAALGGSDARRARGSREEPRQTDRREHGRCGRAVRPPAVLLLRPLRARLRSRRRARQPTAHHCRLDRCRPGGHRLLHGRRGQAAGRPSLEPLRARRHSPRPDPRGQADRDDGACRLSAAHAFSRCSLAETVGVAP